MELDTADDASLLRAHSAGDLHAFARLYDRYDGACYRFIRRTLASAHAEAADDLHQETWLSVSRNAAHFDPNKASFSAWLFAIARNKVCDHLRRQKVVVFPRAADDDAMTVKDPGPTPLEHALSRETALSIAAAVEALPLAQRETFVLFVHAGLSLEDIAQITGAPLETAKSRLRYARATLRLALADERPAHA